MSFTLLTTLVADPRGDKNGNIFCDDRQHENAEKLVQYIKELNERDLVQPVAGRSLLETLEPTRNTISHLAVLSAYKNISLRTRQLSPNQLEKTLSFFSLFDPVQVRYVGSEFRSLLHWLASYYESTNDSTVVPVIGNAILRLDPDGSTFTSNHLLCVRLCLSAGLPLHAMQVLDKDIYNFPTDLVKGIDNRVPFSDHESSATFITRSSGISADITAADVQEYYLLGAQIYMGQRQWSRAKLFLELVLATPSAQVITPLAIEAYKRLILLSLLTTGSPFSSKLMLDQHAYKSISTLSKAYEALSGAFKNRDLQRFYAEVDAGTQVWTDDGNLGLVNHVADSLRRYRVIDLQRTYSALAIERIAVHLSLPVDTTLNLLNSMIRDAHIKAVIQQPDGNDTDRISTSVLRFLSHQPSHEPIGLNQDTVLLSKYNRVEQLSRHVKEANRKLTISKEYTDYIRRSKRAEGAGAPGFEDPMEETWDPTHSGDADEDMMGDM